MLLGARHIIRKALDGSGIVQNGIKVAVMHREMGLGS
jgi:hypothetical protein